MSFDEADVINRLHAVGEALDMPPGTPQQDVLRGRRRVRRNRSIAGVAAAASVVAIVVGATVLASPDRSGQQLSPASDPTAPSSESPTNAAPSPISVESLGAQLDAILTGVRGWTVDGDPNYSGYDYAFNGRCAKRITWGGREVIGGGDGGLGLAGIGFLAFRSEAVASEAAARLIDRLESCTTTTWRTQPIAQTTAVLASSDQAVAWIEQRNNTVRVLQVPTPDGPPPRAVQIKVVDLIDAYRGWQEQSNESGS